MALKPTTNDRINDLANQIVTDAMADPDFNGDFIVALVKSLRLEVKLIATCRTIYKLNTRWREPSPETKAKLRLLRDARNTAINEGVYLDESKNEVIDDIEKVIIFIRNTETLIDKLKADQ